jgi:PAS domain S-box-containing protein
MKSPLRILSLEDDAADADLILATLAKAKIDCDAVRVDTEPDFVNALEKSTFDLILSDHSLPSFDGESALKVAMVKSPAVPFIFVSGAMGEDLAIELIKNGATDYVLKNRLSRLAPAVRRAIAEAEEHAARQEAERSRSAAEQVLRESEVRFRDLFENAPIAYHEIDREGIIRRVNHAECALLKYTGDDLVGRFAWDFVAPHAQNDSRVRVFEKLSGLRAIVPFELEFFCQDGSAILVEVHETLIRDDTGQITGIRSALLDIRQRKVAELASRKAEQYTLELVNKRDQLLEALESARQANLVKSRFLANMSHELRTPLNGVIGLSEILHDEQVGDLSPQQKEYIGDILASGRHLLDLVNNLLDLERVELGKIELCPQVVDVPQLLKEVCDVLRTVAEENGVNVSVTVDPTLSTVTTDPIRLRQIVFNFLANAIKFSPAETLVQVRAIPDEGRRFRVEVADEGPGIKPENLSLLFNDFYQLDRTQKRQGQGAGLGLALVKRIVEAQAGNVGVHSVFGSGSVFYAVLPGRHPGTLQ